MIALTQMEEKMALTQMKERRLIVRAKLRNRFGDTRITRTRRKNAPNQVNNK